ncbi:MAG: NIPSNAP family protein [Verrucomicrobia bacterium]|nr:NIPSNAP family protein [Verrucomicrobiota bacterium]
MKTSRRTFLKTSLAASAATALSHAPLAGAEKSAGRDYYELRAYRLKPGAATAPLDRYLEKALLPALAKRGVKEVGVFTELEVDKKAGTSKPKAETPVWVLIRHTSLDTFVAGAAELNADAEVQSAGADYLNVPKASPAFDRIDTWLYRAFKGMPRMEQPVFSKNRTPTRVFEMRDYESHSERAALSKMAMFDNGETQLMRDLGMSPVFFGQSIAGPNLPHLRYMTSGSDLAAHLAGWAKFGPDPRWKAMSGDPQYKDNTSKNTARFLVPTAYSQI